MDSDLAWVNGKSAR